MVCLWLTVIWISTALMPLFQIADGACSSAVNALEAWDDVDMMLEYDVGDFFPVVFGFLWKCFSLAARSTEVSTRLCLHNSLQWRWSLKRLSRYWQRFWRWPLAVVLWRLWVVYLVMAYSCRDGLDILSRRFRFDLKYASDLDGAGTGIEAGPVLFFYPLSESEWVYSAKADEFTLLIIRL